MLKLKLIFQPSVAEVINENDDTERKRRQQLSRALNQAKEDVSLLNSGVEDIENLIMIFWKRIKIFIFFFLKSSFFIVSRKLFQKYEKWGVLTTLKRPQIHWMELNLLSFRPIKINWSPTLMEQTKKLYRRILIVSGTVLGLAFANDILYYYKDSKMVKKIRSTFSFKDHSHDPGKYSDEK